MNHLFTRAGGVWADFQAVLASELADFDAKTVDSLSSTGGVYALNDPLIIGGAIGTFFELDLPVTISDDVLMNGGLFEAFAGTILLGAGGSDISLFGDTLDINSGIVTLGNSGADAFVVAAFSIFNDIVNFNGDVFFNTAPNFTAGGDLEGTFSFHDCIVTMGASGSDAFTCHAFAQFTDITILSGDTFLSGAVTLSAPLTVGSGGFMKKRIVTPPDANATFAVTSVDEVFMPGGVLTASRDWLIDDTGAQDGAKMRFINQDATHGINLKKPGGILLTGVQASTGAFLHMRVDVRRIAGVWTVVDWSGAPGNAAV